MAKANELGLSNTVEGTPLYALAETLPPWNRAKLYGRVAVSTFGVYIKSIRQLRAEGLDVIDKHQERMQQLQAQIVFDALRDHPELFRPERLLEEGGDRQEPKV